MRGTPQQIIEKYLTLARDAQLSNDRVAEQAFFQHAEHYTRLLGEALREQAERQQQQQGNQNHQQQYGRGGDDQQPRNGDDGRDYNNVPRDDNGDRRAEAAQDRREQPEPRPAPQPADTQPAEQPDVDAPPAAEAPPARNQRNRRSPVAALPDAVGTDGDGEEGRVDTPEEKAPSRRPRAPRSANPAPRARRKPATDEAGAAPADSAEQG